MPTGHWCLLHEEYLRSKYGNPKLISKLDYTLFDVALYARYMLTLVSCKSFSKSGLLRMPCDITYSGIFSLISAS